VIRDDVLSQVRLFTVPIDPDEAYEFVARHHRHHAPPPGCKWCTAVADGRGVIRGVAVIGRPSARSYDDGWTLEVTRTATDGAPNANSHLYGAAWRQARERGYRRLITYTQRGESGTSLRAAGWRVIAERPPRKGWSCPSRPRLDRGVDGIARTLWEAS